MMVRCIMLLALLVLKVDVLVAQKVLLFEDFESPDFTDRGWYDGFPDKRTNREYKNGTYAYEGSFKQSETTIPSGRHLFTPTDKVYISYWIKYSANWMGSGVAYHPHEFYLLTTADSRFQGPSDTHLTVYIEQNAGRPQLALQDSKNIDTGCVILNKKAFVGCNGNPATYRFGENRSVAASNGLQGYVDLSDSFRSTSNSLGYYSSRTWRADTVYFRNEPGKYYKSDWHFVEAYFELNEISNNKGIPNGKIRYWLDGRLLISSDSILFRTAQHPDMKFNQLMYGPYMGVGSPVDQKFWIDDLTIADGMKR